MVEKQEQRPAPERPALPDELLDLQAEADAQDAAEQAPASEVEPPTDAVQAPSPAAPEAAREEELPPRAQGGLELSLANSLVGSGPAQAPIAFDERFRLEGSLGRGGMGHVYAAYDTLLGRRVALKRVQPPPGSEGGAFRQRLVEEARALASIEHPHVVRLHDLGKDRGGLYLSMELLEGGSLADRLASGPLPVDRAVALGAQMCDALEASHAQGVVHRDVKPANILFDQAENAKLGDFGLARSGGGLALTREGSALGTLAYMAPEQARDAANVDARADIYGLGATLYHCVTGESPRVVRESKLPPGLREVLLKALEERPEARYGDAQAFKEALLHISERPPTPLSAVQTPLDSALALLDANLERRQPGHVIWLCLVWGELHPEWRDHLAPRFRHAREQGSLQTEDCRSCRAPTASNLLMRGCCEDCALEEAQAFAATLESPQSARTELARIAEAESTGAALLWGLVAMRLNPALRSALEPELAGLQAVESRAVETCMQCGQRGPANQTYRIDGRSCCYDCLEQRVASGLIVDAPRESEPDLVQGLWQALLTLLMLPVLLVQWLFKQSSGEIESKPRR